MNGSSSRALVVPIFFACVATAQCTTPWATFGPAATNGVVDALVTLPDGSIVAGGYFTSIGGATANHVARWNGSSWSPLGAGVGGDVRALLVLPTGELIAGGDFLTAGGLPASRVARWDGSSWSAMGQGTNGTVLSLTATPNGDVVAGGWFGLASGAPANFIARWNGTAWSPLGPGVTHPVIAVAALANGDVVASCAFSSGGVAFSLERWDGASWSQFAGGADNFVRVLRTLPNGDLLAGGDFWSIGGVAAANVARWNGTSWAPFGSGLGSLAAAGVTSVAPLPNGDLVAGGYFVTPASRIARWNGASWSPLGPATNDAVFAVTASPTGTIVVGGNFSTAGGLASPFVARLTTTCPATAVPLGSGCPSSGGSNTLAVTSLPWTGSTFRVTGTGLPSLALVCVVTGFTTLSVPLFPLHSAGQQGCNLLVTPDAIDFLITTTGTCEAQLALPNTAALAGIVVHQQMVPFEVDPALAVLAVTSTNAVTATVGSF